MASSLKLAETPDQLVSHDRNTATMAAGWGQRPRVHERAELARLGWRPWARYFLMITPQEYEAIKGEFHLTDDDTGIGMFANAGQLRAPGFNAPSLSSGASTSAAVLGLVRSPLF